MKVSRSRFDVGLLTNQGKAMLGFWRDEMGFPIERKLRPVDGVVLYKLTMMGAVLKLDCLERDQVEDYAQRKGWTVAECERWLAPILNYDAHPSPSIVAA
jgi:hypothetical protein